MAIIVIAYNVIALVTGPALNTAVTSATLPSEAAWTLTAGDLLILAGLCLLFLEIVKASRSWRAGVQVLIAIALLIGLAPPASAQRSGADLPADAKQRLETLLEELGTPAAAPLPEGARFLVRFRGDVDGLKPGAAVRIRGFRIGTCLPSVLCKRCANSSTPSLLWSIVAYCRCASM